MSMNHQSCKIFFASRVDSNNCVAFKAIFDQPDTYNEGKSRLQNIWDQLPSDTNHDYAGMDQKHRQSTSFQRPLQQSYTSDDGILAYIFELAVAIAITNDDAIASLFRSTNLRIYQALLGVDAVIGATNSTTSSLMKPDVSTTS
ncbi:a149a41a-577a-46f2-b01e-81ee9bec7826 [Sclerotinia trifoliorum]|uniref:A149a41a-577a-46f2-b01e-81ee9bec7826 n=1 Tax=Sclerotinia trifoliorum TaxID=28548 RepID=A0A8H2ZKW8_9HELO|nr:a149a41a-577a-46f2-b01e-81ee9bec7826 [Sclerotinia trifoliorum]